MGSLSTKLTANLRSRCARTGLSRACHNDVLQRFVLFVLTATAVLVLVGPVNAQYVKSTVATFSTNNPSFVDVTGGQLTFTPVAASEVWIVLLSGRLSSTLLVGGTAADAQYVVNGVPRGFVSVRNEAAGPGGALVHFDRVTGTTVLQTVKVQIRDGSGGANTTTLDNLSMVAFRLPSGADFQFADTMGIRAVASGVWTGMQSLTFTPSSPGNYFVMAVATGREDPSNDTINVRLQDPTGGFWPFDDVPAGRLGQFENGRNNWPPFLLARVENLTATSKTYTIEAEGGALGSSIQDTRIMAFRTDAFDNVQSVEDIGATTTTASTTPVVKTTLNTVAPPAARDHIILQTMALQGVGSTDEIRSGFERNDSVIASYGLAGTSPRLEVTYGLFDAITTAGSMKLENTYSTSNAASSVDAKESVIHVLRLPSAACCTLQTSEGAGTITVTAPDSFEMRFNEATGAGIDEFFDLAEDPASTVDLAGGIQGIETLFTDAIEVGGVGDWYDNAQNPSELLVPGSLPRLDLLESTPARVRVRSEASYYYEGSGALLPSVKAWSDYSVYPIGRLAYRINRRTTAAVTYLRSTLSMGVHLAGAPLASWAAYSQSGGLGTRPPTDAFGLFTANVAGARTDFLEIPHRNWTVATGHPFPATEFSRFDWGPDEYALVSWRENVGGTLPSGTSEAWDFLAYVKPTNFIDNNDANVIARSNDYRTPDSLSAIGPGSGWNENPADADFFNESEAAYTLDADPATGLSFDMDGSVSTRYSPFFKVRQWRWFGPPATILVEAVTKSYNLDYKAAVKPVSRAHFAETISWHSTLESAGVTMTPEIGGPGTINGGTAFGPGRFGRAGIFMAAGANVTFSSGVGNFNKTRGALEFWYRPSYAHTDGVRHVLWQTFNNATHYFSFEKTAGDQLLFSINNGGPLTDVQVAFADYSWSANDWVHLRATWDATAALADQVKIFVNGVEPTHAGPAFAYNDATMLVGTNYIGSDSTGAVSASGLIDEFHLYSGPLSPATPAPLAAGGLTSSASEFLADPVKNFTLGFTAVGASGQGRYLYLGTDAQFHGLNVGLATAGAGVAAGDLDWEYWNGTAWTSLESVGGFTDETDSLTKTGSVYWTSDPTSWSVYSVDGGPDLYYVRLHLATGAAYSTAPIEGVIKTDILLFQYCDNVTSAAQTFVFDPPVPTAVELASFDGRGMHEAVSLEWETASELNNLGFHLYRATSGVGPFTRISSLIPGLGSSPSGAAYAYRDTGLTNGVTYYYELEDVEATGGTKRHGPVAVTPTAGVPESERSASAEAEDLQARVTFGEPKASGFRIVPRKDGVMLELDTAGFVAVPQKDGTVRLEVPGLEELAGSFLPVKRAWVDAVAGRDVKLVSVRALDVERFSGLRPSAAVVSELEASMNGTVRARLLRRGRRLVRREAAKLLEVAYQGETKKALLELSPLTWDGSGLVLAKRLEVHVAFRGREPTLRRTRRANGEVALRVATVARGLYAVPLESVLGRRRRVPPLRLSRQGEDVAHHLEDGTLYFWSEGAAANPFGREAVYELELGVDGAMMDVVNDAMGPSAASYPSDVEREENRYYQAGLVSAPDVWLWEVLFAPERKSFPFEVSALADVSESATLDVWLQGTSDLPNVEDHHVRAYVNGIYVAETRWDGKTARQFSAELGAGVLREGENRLELESVLDSGATHSMLMLDRFRVRYPRAVSVLEQARYVLDLTGPTPRWVSSRQGFDAERAYVAVEDVLRADVRKVPSTKMRKRRRSDYLVIGPQTFLDSAKPLLLHRKKQGLRVMSASTEAIASELGHGELTPDSIREAIANAYNDNRGRTLRYVLLLGDATYDFKDYLGTGVTNQVPPYMVRTSYLWTASDPAYAAVHGDDLLPDVAIGRLPAKTTDELTAMVEKILAYERGELAADAAHVLVADNADPAGNFEGDAEEIAATFFAGLPTRRIFLSELGTSAARDAIVASFDAGATTVSYLGHGGIHLWADENLFNASRVALLAPQSTEPLLLTMNCLNGYFHFPYFDSLGEALLKPRDKGVIAAFSPSGLSLNGPAHTYHKALLQELVGGAHPRLGDAILEAQRAYADTSAFPELLSIYHLFGDPALVLK